MPRAGRSDGCVPALNSIYDAGFLNIPSSAPIRYIGRDRRPTSDLNGLPLPFVRVGHDATHGASFCETRAHRGMNRIAIASIILREIESEERWDELFARAAIGDPSLGWRRGDSQCSIRPGPANLIGPKAIRSLTIEAGSSTTGFFSWHDGNGDDRRRGCVLWSSSRWRRSDYDHPYAGWRAYRSGPGGA